MSEISNLHDKYFKELMENPQIAAKFLQEMILPEEIKEHSRLFFPWPETRFKLRNEVYYKALKKLFFNTVCRPATFLSWGTVETSRCPPLSPAVPAVF